MALYVQWALLQMAHPGAAVRFFHGSFVTMSTLFRAPQEHARYLAIQPILNDEETQISSTIQRFGCSWLLLPCLSAERPRRDVRFDGLRDEPRGGRGLCVESDHQYSAILHAP